MSTNYFYEQGDTPPPPNTNEVEKNRHASSGYSAVIVPSCIIIVPMLLFPALLLGIIFHYRINGARPLFENLKGSDEGLDQNAYYVDMSATTIATIASWSSSVALSLVGFAMALWTYSISMSLLSQSNVRLYTQLPTPFQFALLLKLVDGGIAPLWDAFRYAWGWRKKRSKLSPVVLTTAAILFIGLALR
jgi:hypothetical protein